MRDGACAWMGHPAPGAHALLAVRADHNLRCLVSYKIRSKGLVAELEVPATDVLFGQVGEVFAAQLLDWNGFCITDDEACSIYRPNSSYAPDAGTDSKVNVGEPAIELFASSFRVGLSDTA